MTLSSSHRWRRFGLNLLIFGLGLLVALIILEVLLRLAGPGRLYRCGVCRLQFRYPLPSPRSLAAAYAGAPAAGPWARDRETPAWRRVRALLTRAPGRRILDVGCTLP